MCDPVSAIMAASTAVSITGDVLKNQSERKRANQVKESANVSAGQQLNALSLRAIQEKDSASQSIMGADRSARIADAQARVSAGESGVAGASVDALLHDIERQKDEYRTATNINLDNTLTQIDSEKRGVLANRQSQINSAPNPSNFATGLSIVGRGLDFANQIQIRKPKP